MAHDHIRARLPRLADGALGPVGRFLAARHVARCPACAGELENLLSMQSVMRTALPYHHAPPGLAARIGASLPNEAPPPVPSWLRLPLRGLAVSGMAGALAGVAMTLLVIGHPGSDQAVLRDVVASHVRSMMADHLTDVTTADRHTVKPWLTQRLDVAPPVRDLAAEGFPLVGGRLEYVDEHSSAAVVYQRARHVINLFAWAAPGQPDAGFSETALRGFNIVAWRRDGVAYHAVSDVEANELAQFARLVMAN